MLQAFLYGAVGMTGVLIAYTIYDYIYTLCSNLHARKIAAQHNSKRRRR